MNLAVRPDTPLKQSGALADSRHAVYQAIRDYKEPPDDRAGETLGREDYCDIARTIWDRLPDPIHASG